MNKTIYAHSGVFGGQIAPTKMIEDRAQGFRWLEREDGSKVLQAACPWSEGIHGGTEWREIPTVKDSR